MKVCMVLASKGVGGLENHVADLANELAKSIQVAVVAPASFGSRLGRAVEFVPLDLTGFRRNPLTLVRLGRILRRIAPDVVHAHANKAAAMVRPLRRGCPAGYVATVHNIKRDVRVFSAFDRVIAVSRTVADTIPYDTVRVVYNGINYNFSREGIGPGYYAEQLGLTLPGPVAVAVGRLVPAKGFDLLLKAWREVDAQLLIVGDGPDRAKLTRQAQEEKVAERVHFLGFRKDVLALMAASDLFVMSSRREGFPIVLVEALHSGVPVVATAVPGACEVLPADVLVPVGDSATLARTVNKVFSWSAAQRREHYRECFRMAGEELTVAAMTRKTLDIYREVADGS